MPITETRRMGHVVLLGDSILDNADYVPGPAVVDQLRTHMTGWEATLLARDGAMVEDVGRQLPRVPRDATHAVLSVGGNDALQSSGFLESGGIEMAEGFSRLADVQARFRYDYGALLGDVVDLGLRTVVLTVYDAVPGLPSTHVAGLSLFNDVVVREAARLRTQILDLRRVCTEMSDFSDVSPIEPSETGGAKIVDALQPILERRDDGWAETVVHGG